MNCEYCNKACKSKTSYVQHRLRCSSNPDRLRLNEWTTERREQHSSIMKRAHNNSNRVYSDETLAAISARSKEFNSRYWTVEQKQAHSELMRNIVVTNPESYSVKNVSGRVKMIDYNGVLLKGTWEVLVAKWLDDNTIKWTNKVDGFDYKWNNKIHLYFPDFYLPDLDMYIEVKGYERERDRCKWNSFPKHLKVLKLNEINLIKLGKLTKEILRGNETDM